MWLLTLSLLCVVEIFLVDYVATAPGGRGNTKGSGKNEKCKKLKFAVREHQDNEDVRVFVGSDYTFDCTVIGTPEPNVTWTKDDTALKDVSYRVFGRGGLEKVFVLKLKNLLVADAGRYKCTADNGECKSISTTLRLLVTKKEPTEIPRIKELLPLNPKIYIGESVKFTCIVQKFEDFTPFIKWVRYTSFKSLEINRNIKGTNVTSVRSSLSPGLTTTTTTAATTTTATISNTLNVDRLSTTRYTVDGVVHETKDMKLETGHRSELVVSEASRLDTGVYSCVAFNEVGFDKVDSHLQVEPFPDLSKEELERIYFKKYGTSIKLPFSLATVVVIPVCLLIILIIGCVWWHSNQQKLEDERKDLERQKQIENSKMDEKKTVPIVSVQSTSSDSANVGCSSYHAKQNEFTNNYPSDERSLRNINEGKRDANVNESDVLLVDIPKNDSARDGKSRHT